MLWISGFIAGIAIWSFVDKDYVEGAIQGIVALGMLICAIVI